MICHRDFYENYLLQIFSEDTQEKNQQEIKFGAAAVTNTAFFQRSFEKKSVRPARGNPFIEERLSECALCPTICDAAEILRWERHHRGLTVSFTFSRKKKPSNVSRTGDILFAHPCMRGASAALNAQSSAWRYLRSQGKRREAKHTSSANTTFTVP
ncbi:hypothetical protein HYPSUDRAFT_877112 [Hypholoma sublateritium FD-334 SS-4]|uniref:Uncharacterized protein n=1 Tax=Hypholoma sublateritium (strain FD-334 SS-4) TaxID=945553 RepID=A0A0D2PH25_HYPSF|nr:hypothetical protein HYPSUDRAFT_877112 [Hypholoma sublateritium FD-334 SS-4]